MFHHAKAFNQNLSAWNVSNVTGASDIFEDSGLSQENYCKMITTNEGWKRLSEEFDLGLDYTCE
jgi:surface protein